MKIQIFNDLHADVRTLRPIMVGHVHSSFDYGVGRTRILCIPHGYGHENTAFNPAQVVEVG